MDTRHGLHCLATIVALILVAIAHPSKLLAQGTLVALYSFDGNANDESGNNHHGTLHGPVPATDRFGNPNSAFAFDGGDWIEVQHADDLNFGPASTFTINVWVKACASQVDFAGIIAKGPANTYIPGYQLVIRDKQPEGLISQNNEDFVGVLGTKAILDSSWHMLTLIVDAPAGEVRMYIDGELNKVSRATAPIDPSVRNDSNLFIGKERNSSRYAKGAIDDISIFDYALSDATIRAQYTEGGWPFFAGQGSLTIATPDGISYCTSGSLRLVASGSLRYRWFPATGLSNANIANPIASPATTTTYTVFGLREDLPCGTTLTTQVTITVGKPIPDLGDDTAVCAGSSVQIGAVPRGGTPPFRYTWTPATGLSDATAERPFASPTTATRYIVNVTDAEGCVGSDTITVDVSPIALTASASALDFGELADCSSTADSTFTVRNSGTIPLDLNNLVISGGGFSVVSVMPARLLAPGATAVITVRFAPVIGGSSSGRLEIHSAPCDAALIIDLLGARRTLTADVATSPIDFSTDEVCAALRRDTTIVVTNTGSEVLTVHGGIVAPPFSVVSPLPIDIAPGASQTITIRSEPTFDGLFQDTLLLPVSSRLCADTLRVVLLHRRVGVIVAITGQADFGSSFPGALVDRIQIVKNLGLRDVQVDSLTVGAPFSIVSSTPVPPVVLRPGDSIIVSTRYIASSARDTSQLMIHIGQPCSYLSSISLTGAGDERAYCRVYIPNDLNAKSKDVFDVPLMIDSSNALQSAGAYRFRATIAFERSLLFPEALTSTTQDSVRRVVVSGTRRDDSDVLEWISMTAMLGRVDTTAMMIESFEWIEPREVVSTTTVDGMFVLDGNCPEGGERQYLSTGQLLLRAVIPNPVRSSGIVALELVESGFMRLNVVDALGSTVMTISEQVVRAGAYAIPLDVTPLPAGVYLLVLETPTQVRSERFEVVR